MNNRRHHFVPQFYLRRFSDDQRRINVFSLDRAKAFLRVSLRDQAYRHKFYGNGAEVESFFSDFERLHAPLLDRIVSAGLPPTNPSADHLLFCIFTVLQLVRTTAAARESGAQVDALLKEIVRTHPDGGTLDLDRVVAKVENAIVLSLRDSPLFAVEISDLRSLLLTAPGQSEFILSDNPVVLYNQWAEHVTGRGTTGLSLAGLQIFVPISPKVLLLMYDASTYARRGHSQVAATPSTTDDVFQLNLLQAVFAEENLYFHDVPEPLLQSLGRAARRRRPQHSTSLRVLAANEAPTTSRLCLQHTQVPCLPLRLSFLRLQETAARIVPSRRWAYREGHRPEQSEEPPALSGFTLQTTRKTSLRI